MRILSIAAAICCSVVLSGCVHTQEMPLAPNVVRLDTTASGLLSSGQSVPQTMRRAAELTLQHGYTKFRFQDVQMGSGSQYVGTYETASATVSGSPYMASGQASGLSVPIYRHHENVGVTVVMFHDGEPGSQGAFDARSVLAEQVAAGHAS